MTTQAAQANQHSGAWISFTYASFFASVAMVRRMLCRPSRGPTSLTRTCIGAPFARSCVQAALVISLRARCYR